MNKNLQLMLILLCTSSLSPSLLVAMDNAGLPDVNMEDVGQAEPTAKRSQGVSIRQLLQEGKIPNVHVGGLLDGELSFIGSFPEINDLTGLREIKDINRVKKLDFRSNDIATLPSGILDDFVNLEDLNLSYNKIKTLPSNLLRRLKKLKKIDLKENRLTNLPEDIFSGLNNLKVIDLVENMLTNLPEDIFSGLNNLEVIDLRRNNITEVPVGIFKDLHNLRTLRLPYELKTLPKGILKNSSKLEILSFGDNIYEKGAFLKKRNLEHFLAQLDA